MIPLLLNTMLCRIHLFFWLLSGVIFNAEAIVPNVVVTIKPIHSLVAGVMAGVKQPILLMSGERSPHTQPLAPTEVRQIQKAKIIIWVGPSYETPLTRVIEGAKSCQRVICLQDMAGLKLYPPRQGGLWGNHDHVHEHDDTEKNHHHVHHHHSKDGHLWLDPQNAIVIVNGLADQLSIIDPQHADRYNENAKRVIKRLEALDDELQILLAPVRDKPYVVYHDGTQYFDRHFKTKAIGVLMGDSHYGFNAQHFLQISDYIQNNNVECVFTEPQFSTDKITTLMDNTNVHIGTLDYLGIGLKPDENAYFVMMHNLALAFIKGLKES